MTDFLIFQMKGIMTSWGEVAVGDVRSTADHPTRSAIIGMLGAALGINRTRGDELNALGQSVHVATQEMISEKYQKPLPLYDYHTIQSPKRDAKRNYATRYEEIHSNPKHKLPTKLTDRYYLCDDRQVVAIWLRDAAQFSLQDLKTALQAPHYVLYLGRKTNPLCAPPNPMLVSQTTLAGAFSDYVDQLNANGPTHQKLVGRFYTDNDKAISLGGSIQETRLRRDVTIDRSARWGFEDRAELVVSISQNQEEPAQ